MKVEVVGFEPDVAEELRGAANYFAKILFHGNMANKISLTVYREPALAVEGECWPEDDKHRTFGIEIRDGDADDDVISTLAHEMVHCKQWARKQFNEKPFLVTSRDASGAEAVEVSVKRYWEGEVWKPQPGEHPYFDCPWEIEAYGRENGMVARWIDFRNKRKKNKNDKVTVATAVCSLSDSSPDDSECCSDSYYYGGA